MVVRVAAAMALKPRRVEVAPSKLKVRSTEFPPLMSFGAAAVAVVG